jgi:guanosine-3',5'-bis(diphosphate) 3'-pyrophosphohydrolase
LKVVSKALKLSRESHRFQLRKDGKTPFINHPLELYEILLDNEILDEEILSAALLHDVIEDTEYTKEDMEFIIGEEITRIVLECSDDKSLSKVKRKLLQIEHSLEISEKAVLVKLVDKISNLKSIIEFPPIGWDNDRIIGYVVWSKKVVNNLNNNKNIFRYRDKINNLTNLHTFLVLEIFENYKMDISDSEDIFNLYIEKIEKK